MVLEQVQADVKPGSEATFEQLCSEIERLIGRAKGCISVRAMRCVEKPNRFRLLVEWETIEAHTQGFRGSPDHKAVLEMLTPHVDGATVLEHYQLTAR
jgi:heme-degrading monooxygenase HmoA